MPPRGDLFPGGIELLAWRGAVGERAVADVGQGQVLEVAVEERRVGLDGVRGEAKVAGPSVRPLAEVDPAFERDAEDDDPGVRQATLAGDEAG